MPFAHRCTIVAALALAGAVSSAGAQAAPRRGPGWEPHLGIHVGSPQRLSLAIGIMRPVWRAPDFTSAGGPRLVIEPGLRAGKLRLGYARTGAFAFGYALEAAAMREWAGSGVDTLPSASYGVELHGSALFMDLGVGLYRRARGGSRFTLSAGLVL